MYRSNQLMLVWATVDFGAETDLPESAEFLPLPDRDSLSDTERAVLDDLVERDRLKFEKIPSLAKYEHQVAPMLTALLQSPRLAKLWTDFGDFFTVAEARGTFRNRERALADIALLGELSTTAWTQAGHVHAAVAEGITPTDVKSILDGDLDTLAPADRQLVDYARLAARAELGREAFGALVERLGVKGAVEYTGYVTYKCALQLTLAAVWQIQGLVEEPALLQDVLQSHLDGAEAVDDARVQTGWVPGRPTE
ncbi:hypothetical protein AB0M32_42435 [Streptomyces sp. NPDC051985]|uniref:hypothetical protein n=1 Tax=Streptomyces sp. NPDC051985 TaxID=3155807 RepID=UPI003434A0D2